MAEHTINSPDKGTVPEHHEAIPPKLLASEAKRAAESEQDMSLWHAVKTYRHAIGWSVLLSSTLIMEGYDLALLGNLYASTPFNERYGTWVESDGRYRISAAWQSGLSNGARAGEIFGLIIAGWTADKFGAKNTTILFLLVMIVTIFPLFFAPNIQVLVVGEILCGIPWGAFQSVTPAYASEVTPVRLRPYLTTFINLCWVIGQLMAAAVNRGSVDYGDSRSYRIPFGVQWLWPVLILSGLVFAPESPWWLMRKGDRDGARKALLRLTARDQPGFNVDETIAMIEHTNEMEKEQKEGTSYADCFKGSDLRRTEIVVGIWIVQTLGGQNLMGYAAYFLSVAGMDERDAFSISMASSGVGILGTLGSWFLMTKFGRRRIHFSGLCGQFVLLVIVGSLSFSGTVSSVWAIGAMLVIFTFVYDFAVGPVTYSLISELSSTRLKAKTIVLARAMYNASNIFVNVMTNYQLSASAWNWGALAAYFWAGTCFICVIWVFFRLPEPKDRTYAELDMLFEQRVPARKFAKTKVDPYTSEVVGRKESTVDIDEKR
ncbi:hypothetical protein S40285_04720 [Stachybotrys chlorohalonatus IBT 40285]|uniref:Major facilitator superfamily (MFS) profile domain-containing protein n=1 Tax=Stachybotrys chlorohalonatus (strain IBT 40285) TaxID=1283841 RepID=A0A084Q9V8_STAC4|nr:hypothetical protein S40285_04720 [Stachybotrys chlorohalonata IBT 40285]